MIIYKITNLVTQKIYIGQTVSSLHKRWKAHCCPTSNCRKLKNSIVQHGKDNFKIEMIDCADSLEELNQKEVYWIEFYNSIKRGYNLTSGGNQPRHTEETRKKMSASSPRRKLTESNRALLLRANIGRPMPEHVKKSLLLANKGRKLTKAHREAAIKNLVRDPNASEKMKAYNELRKMNKEVDNYRILKMSESLKGHTRSEVSKLKQSKTLKGRPQPNYVREAHVKTRQYIISRNWKCTLAEAKKRLRKEVIILLLAIAYQSGGNKEILCPQN